MDAKPMREMALHLGKPGGEDRIDSAPAVIRKLEDEFKPARTCFENNSQTLVNKSQDTDDK